MQLPQLTRRSSVSFDMTPMIDVVFLLIIFFLVSSHLARQENRLALDLPSAFSGQEELASDWPRVTIQVQANGTMILAGRMVEPPQLAERLQQERQRQGPNLEVRVRSDRQAPYRAVEPVLAAAAQSGIWNITFAVLPERESR